MANKIEFLVKLLVTVFLLFFLFFKIGLDNIYHAFLHFNVAYMTLVIPVFFVVFIIGAINIAILLIPFKHNLKYSDFLKYYSLSWAMGLLTPGRVGEFSMVYYLSKHGISVGRGTALTLLDKVTTTALYLILGLLGIMLFFYEENLHIFVLVLAIYAFMFFGGIFIFLSHQGRSLIKYILKHRAKQFKGFSKTMNMYITKRPDLILYNTLLSVIKTFLMTLMAYWLFLGFGVHVSFWVVLSVSVLGSIVTIIPISISGLGVRESASVILYSKFGVAPSIVFSNHLITNTITYVSVLIFIYAFRK